MTNEQEWSITGIADKWGIDRRLAKKIFSQAKATREDGGRKYFSLETIVSVVLGVIGSKGTATIDAKIKGERLRGLKLANDESEKLSIPIPDLVSGFVSLKAHMDAKLKQKLTVEWPRAGQGMPSAELYKLGVETYNQIIADLNKFSETW